MRIGDEDGSFVGKPDRWRLQFNRSSIGDGDCTFDMKFTTAAIVEQPERRVTVLLDLCNHQPGANRVDRASGHTYDIAGEYGSPGDEVHDRTVTDSFAQLICRYVSAQAYSDFRAWRRTQHVPRLGFSSCQSDGMRGSVVGMDLDGKRLAGKQ